jgi:hypothetical protein
MDMYSDYGPGQKDLEAKLEEGRRPTSKKRKVQNQCSSRPGLVREDCPEYVPADLRKKYMSGGEFKASPFSKLKV